jgi:hypothetical protein
VQAIKDLAMAESTRIWDASSVSTPWFPVLAGPVVGIIYEALGYLMVSQSCSAGFLGFTLAGVSGIRVLMFILTVVGEAVLIAAIVAGYRGWHREVKGHDEAATTAISRARFMSLVGMILSAGFALYVLYAGLPIFFMDPCRFL